VHIENTYAPPAIAFFCAGLTFRIANSAYRIFFNARLFLNTFEISLDVEHSAVARRSPSPAGSPFHDRQRWLERRATPAPPETPLRVRGFPAAILRGPRPQSNRPLGGHVCPEKSIARGTTLRILITDRVNTLNRGVLARLFSPIRWLWGGPSGLDQLHWRSQSRAAETIAFLRRTLLCPPPTILWERPKSFSQ